MKRVWLAEGDYFAQAAAARAPDVPAAEEPTAVIVPVLGRPQNAAPFMESLQKSGAPLARVYAVANAADAATTAAWLDAGAVVIPWNGPEPGTFAEKVNLGVSAHRGAVAVPGG